MHVHNIHTSSVTYMTMWPYCNYTFVVDHVDPTFETMSLHRFESLPFTASITFNENSFPENKKQKTGEPFTMTPIITTLELENVTMQTFTVSDTSHGILTLVTGKAEDWWLFITIPYYAARIQWQWAFATWDFWFWGVTVLVALLLTWPKRPALLHTIAVFSWVVVSDFLVPLIVLVTVVRWPGGAFFNVMIALKIIALVGYGYIMWKFEIATAGKNGPQFFTLRPTPLSVLLLFFFWLVSCALSIGSYILLPIMFKRYTSRMSIHTSKKGYKIVPTGT